MKDKALEILKNGREFVIFTHIRPDGDALGSASALCLGLRSMGKNCWLFPNSEVSKTFEDITDGLWGYGSKEAIFVAVDTATKERLTLGSEEYTGKIKLLIDHHISSEEYAEITYTDTSASATAEIIYDLLISLNVELNSDIALRLYTGIATDTGCFRFANTTAKTHEIAGNLIKCGFDMAGVNQKIFESKTIGRIKLERTCYDAIRFFEEGKIAILPIPAAVLEETGASEDDLDAISSLPRTIEGVEVAITLKESEHGIVRVSLRTRGGADASEICAHFGGGGHRQAAGCTINDTLENAEKILFDFTVLYLKKIASGDRNAVQI